MYLVPECRRARRGHVFGTRMKAYPEETCIWYPNVGVPEGDMYSVPECRRARRGHVFGTRM